LGKQRNLKFLMGHNEEKVKGARKDWGLNCELIRNGEAKCHPQQTKLKGEARILRKGRGGGRNVGRKETIPLKEMKQAKQKSKTATHPGRNPEGRQIGKKNKTKKRGGKDQGTGEKAAQTQGKQLSGYNSKFEGLLLEEGMENRKRFGEERRTFLKRGWKGEKNGVTKKQKDSLKGWRASRGKEKIGKIEAKKGGRRKAS